MTTNARRLVIAALCVLSIASGPFVLSNFALSLCNDIGINVLVVLGLVMLTGVGGTTSFGQAAFVGIAAYGTAWLTSGMGQSPWLGLLFALSLVAIAALAIGLLTLRLGGHYLPLSSIAWGLSIALLFGNVDGLGQHTGLSNLPPLVVGPWTLLEPGQIYFVIWGVVGFVYLFNHNLLNSRTGRAIRGLRGGNVLLASVGANAFSVRLALFVMAAISAGLAGWLYAHKNRFVSPSPFEVQASIEYLLMAVVGGIGHLSGALVGSALVLLLKNGLQDFLPLLTARGNQLEPLAFAILFILLMQRARGGLMGFVIRWSRRHFPPTFAATVNDAATDPLPKRTIPSKGQSVLRVEGALKRFGGLVAVNGVSFNVSAGDIVGLIGPNGAGKSTMFNLITGTLALTAGRIEFLGRDVSSMPQRRIARLGMARTFQHVKLRPQMSLIDNVALGAYARTNAGVIASGLRLDRREEQQALAEARHQLSRIGLSGREHELAGNLPLGTQRILEIARALAADPVLLVLDEPAAGLRRQEKQALSDLLRKLRDQGVTILIVEHDMDFVMKLVDRLVVMNFGCKLIEGPPSSVRADAAVQAAYLGGGVDAKMSQSADRASKPLGSIPVEIGRT